MSDDNGNMTLATIIIFLFGIAVLLIVSKYIQINYF